MQNTRFSFAELLSQGFQSKTRNRSTSNRTNKYDALFEDLKNLPVGGNLLIYGMDADHDRYGWTNVATASDAQILEGFDVNDIENVINQNIHNMRAALRKLGYDKTNIQFKKLFNPATNEHIMGIIKTGLSKLDNSTQNTAEPADDVEIDIED